MMNREQRRKVAKGMGNERVNVAGIVVHFENGQYTQLDTEKIEIIDKHTKRPLFQEVLEPVAKQVEAATPQQEFKTNDDPNKYSVEFDTPEGRMEYVKNGNFSGVRKV